MNLNFSTEEILFQKEVKDFLDQELPSELVEANRRSSAVFTEKEIAMEWQSILAKKGWLVPSWPEEYGGTDWNEAQKYLFANECAIADAPSLTPMGLGMIGPLLLGMGTKEQKDYYLPRIISGEDYWCQGYSESGSGSDLASLQCKAVREGDKYVINGTKTWTSHAHLANKIFCLVRTDNAGKKQDGITFLMIDMDQEGISVEPILTMAKDHDFNQVIFTNAEVEIENKIGEEGQGWTVAKYLLEFERGGGGSGVAKILSEITSLRTLVKKLSLENNNPSLNDSYASKLSRLEIKAASIQYSALRILGALKNGERPGPESSMMKTLMTQLQQEVSELALQSIGYYGNPFQDTSYGSNEEVIGEEIYRSKAGRYQNLRAASIYGGSNEIQNNIIAKAVLGL